MGIGCRLKGLLLPQELLDFYFLSAIYNSEKIQTQIHRDGVDANSLMPDKKYVLQEIFEKRKKRFSRPLVLEICCGTGDFIVNYAVNHPDFSFLALDYSRPVLERAIIKAHQQHLDNILFYHGKVEDFLFHDFKGSVFNQVFINFPDPWPKKKHLKRRIINLPFLTRLSTFLNEESVIYTATDLAYLYEYHMGILNESSLFENCLSEADIHKVPNPAYLVQSSYEKKGLLKERPVYYTKHRLQR